MKGSQGMNLRQEPGVKNGSRSLGGVLLTSLFPMACSTFFLRTPRTTCPGLVLPTIINQAMTHGIAYRPVWWDNFSIKIVFSDDCSLCIILHPHWPCIRVPSSHLTVICSFCLIKNDPFCLGWDEVLLRLWFSLPCWFLLLNLFHSLVDHYQAFEKCMQRPAAALWKGIRPVHTGKCFIF